MVRVHVRPPPPPRTFSRRLQDAATIFDNRMDRPGEGFRAATARPRPRSFLLKTAPVRREAGGWKRSSSRMKGLAEAPREGRDCQGAEAPARAGAPRASAAPWEAISRRPGCPGAWRMPWRRQATKDAASCEKPRGDACGLRSGGLRMGQPTVYGRCRRTNPWSARREPGEVKHLSSRRKRKQKRFRE